MPWWLWIALGLVLLVIEILTPGGFVALFFGLSAILVGTLGGLGIELPLWTQGLAFAVLSVGSAILLRKPLRELVKPHPSGEIDALIGEVAVPSEDLAPGSTGKVELRGTAWTAKNAGTLPLRKGQRCKVARVDGLLIWIQAE